MNHISVAGNLGRDPEMTYTPTGTACAKFSVADQMQHKKDQETPLTQWWNCIVWGKQAEYFNEHAKKGSKVIVFGRIEKRIYKDKAGKEQTVLEVIAETFSIIGASTSTQKPVADDGVPDDFPF